MATLSRFTLLLCKPNILSQTRLTSTGMSSIKSGSSFPHAGQMEIKLKKDKKIPQISAEDTTSHLNHLRVIAMKRKLFTPGPLMVSDRVKGAMLTDIGKRHAEFPYIVKFVRKALLKIAKVSPAQYTAILLNGSGTFATEATLRTILGNSNKKLLIMENGMYGKRLAEMCRSSGINFKVIPMNMKTLQETLLKSPDISGVIAVHCETSSGIINPVNEIGMIVKKCSPDCLYFVDGMTSFGAIQLNMQNVDFLMSNSCKSLQGVPGVAFVIAKTDMLQKHRCKGNGLVLDIGAQYDELEKTGQFLFTPPNHVMIGFKEALLEFAEEGGLKGRAERYQENTKILKQEMACMGFKQLYRDEENPLGYIITSFKYPNVPQFVFEEFYKRLSDAGHVISSESSLPTNCFRIGSIGHMYPDDIRELTISIRDVCQDMRIELPLK